MDALILKITDFLEAISGIRCHAKLQLDTTGKPPNLARLSLGERKAFPSSGPLWDSRT